MNYRVNTSKRGPTSGPRKVTLGGIVHTTEGHEPGDLAALTTNVSIHKYIPRRKGIVYEMVPLSHVAYHAGWGRLAASDSWSNHWNSQWVGWEIGHRKGERWSPEHLARCLQVIRGDCQTLRLPRLLRHQDIAAGRPASLNGPRTDPTDFPFWASFRDLCFQTPYELRGPPDIPLSPWVRALRPILSPEDAQDGYARVLRRKIKPGPILALIGKESSFGTEGVATRTLNWGNVRTPMNPGRVRATVEGWPVFHSWLDSLDDVLDRLEQKPDYFPSGNDELATVRCIWSPVGDGANNPFADALTMRRWITDWSDDMADYHGLWGTEAPYIAEWGIASLWRELVDAGRNPGPATAPEVLIDSTTYQVFAHCIIAWTAATGARVFWPEGGS